MFSILFENLLALGWAMLLSIAALAIFTAPFVTWVEVSRALLRPLLRRMTHQRGYAQYRVTDLGCLVAEMSVLGMITAQLMALRLNPAAAALLLMLLSILALVGWRCAIDWLGRTGVRDLVRRAVFQLLVVPTALFFPLMFLFLAVLSMHLLRAGQPLNMATLARGLAVAAIGTILLMRLGHRLAVWVALGARA